MVGAFLRLPETLFGERQTMPKATSATKARAPSKPRKTKTAAMPSEDQRRQMIAEAAYFRAAERGFQGGDPLEDWLQAEAHIATLITH